MTKKRRIIDGRKGSFTQKEVNIFGITIVSTRKDTLLKQVEEKIIKKRKFLIVTPNPEILLKARKNKKLQDVINSAEIKVADGEGIKFAYRCLNKRFSVAEKSESFQIIKGRELFMDLIEMSSSKKWKVFLLGGTDDVAKITKRKLESKFKGLRIECDSGPKLNEHAEPKTKKDEEIERNVISKINDFKPDIVFVAFGAPKQELWSSRNLSKLKIKAIMVVGGTYDYISGKYNLPPKWMDVLGIEWLWRLVTQPKRIGRIFRATIIFPYYLLKN